MLIGSLVLLFVGLHSYLCFSLLEKLFWKAGSTPPRRLLDTLLSVKLLKFFYYRNPNSSSIPGGLIENAPASSIASRYLVDRSSFCSWIWFLVARYLLDTSAVDDLFLDTYLDSFLDTSRYLICQALLKVLYKPPCAIRFSFLQSLSICPHLFISQTLSFHSNCVPQGFFKLFQVFLHLVSFYSLILHAFHVLKPRFWDFVFENFGVFQNWWVFNEILGWVFI